MSLSPAQLAVLKTDILANTATIPAGYPWTGGFAGVQVKDVPNNGDGNFAVAGWYSQVASPAYVVWRDLPMETVLAIIAFANMTPVDAVPSVTSLPSNPTAAQNATYNNQMAAVHIWNARNGICQSKQMNLQNLIISRTTAPMRQSSYRSAVQDCLTSLPAGANGLTLAANWVGVRDAAKFSALYVEKLFATGAGTFASPADLAYEGAIDANDVENALNLA